jgi:hypothetical protein
MTDCLAQIRTRIDLRTNYFFTLCLRIARPSPSIPTTIPAGTKEDQFRQRVALMNKDVYRFHEESSSGSPSVAGMNAGCKSPNLRAYSPRLSASCALHFPLVHWLPSSFADELPAGAEMQPGKHWQASRRPALGTRQVSRRVTNLSLRSQPPRRPFTTNRGLRLGS